MRSQSSTKALPKVLISGLLSLVIIAFVFTIYRITPFGNHNLLVSDMGAQYTPFFSYLHHVFTSGNFYGFNFTMGIGSNVFPTVAYYLISPFNLIILLFPLSGIPTALSIILMLKIASISMTMNYFLQRHFNTSSWGTIAFSIAFSLCGFVSINFINIMWLDALICLPMVTLGIDNLRQKGKPGTLFFWLLAAIVTNYYIGYMLGLFTIIYAVYLLIIHHEDNQGFVQTLKANSTFIKNWVITELLTGISSVFILFPAFLSMMKTAKSTTAISFTDLTPQFGLEVLSQLGSGGVDYLNRLDHAPAIFATLVMALLAITFFIHPNVQRKQKIGGAFVLIVLAVSMTFEPLDVIWHMLHSPEGFPYRYSFLFSFFLILLAYSAWQKNPKLLSNTKKFLSLGTLVTLLIIGSVFNDVLKRMHMTTYQSGVILPVTRVREMASLLALNLVIALIAFFVVFYTKKQAAIISLTALTILEVGTNLAYSFHDVAFGNQKHYAKIITKGTNLFKKTGTYSTNKIFRVVQTDTLLNKAFGGTYVGYNDPETFAFNGLTDYSSTVNNSYRQMQESLGLYSKNSRRIKSAGSSDVSKMLLGVKYTLDTSTKQMAQNPYYLGLGFPVSKNFSSLKLSKTKIFANLENSLQALKPSKSPYLVQLTNVKTTRSNKSKKYKYRFHIYKIAKVSGPVYMNASAKIVKYGSIKIKNRVVKDNSGDKSKQNLVNLGSFKKGQTIDLGISSNKASITSDVNLVSLDQAKFASLVQYLKPTSFNPTQTKQNVSGTVNNLYNQKELYVSIPYDEGWNATINNKKVKVASGYGSMIKLPLQSGTNHVSLKYRIPGFASGLIISVLGLLGFIVFDFESSKHKRLD